MGCRTQSGGIFAASSETIDAIDNPLSEMDEVGDDEKDSLAMTQLGECWVTSGAS